MPSRWVTWIATWFGCGYSKRAPGTVGSLGAVPLFLLLKQADPTGAVLYWSVVVTVCLLGTWSAHRFAGSSGAKDPQQVVVDEVAGTLIALGMAHAHGALALVTAWVFFRALDILKPWPVSLAERATPVGLGIMLDDLVAGALAGLAALLIFS